MTGSAFDVGRGDVVRVDEQPAVAVVDGASEASEWPAGAFFGLAEGVFDAGVDVSHLVGEVFPGWVFVFSPVEVGLEELDGGEERGVRAELASGHGHACESSCVPPVHFPRFHGEDDPAALDEVEDFQ